MTMPFFTFIYPNLKAYLDPCKSLIFRPLWSQKEPSTKAPGFLFLRAFKIHFDKRLKIKNENCFSSLGAMLVMNPIKWIMKKSLRAHKKNPARKCRVLCF